MCALTVEDLDLQPNLSCEYRLSCYEEYSKIRFAVTFGGMRKEGIPPVEIPKISGITKFERT
ncbi:Hypothetical protein LEPBI_I0462 [Leptospira biflexa serovar Patoc strain 'Patoc 1 (Paris)']|uniref:Uncharacterized protein n=1 Tax=Leptospira biflexa serovar Patoc (strain Patoc 1 / ATCC 23582 / Paris) TaxID=456481 RepID=B0SJM7_LEPBP|nr:Hypothetical protein LEPBI_I0462 [Leptospira biflexa serovar Patoc strain 'Patoc 1 (Paris)']